MEHTMHLFTRPYDQIKEGSKKVEIRLNDEKRQQISLGDLITFIKLPNKDENLQVRVNALYRVKTREKMLDLFSLSSFGDYYTSPQQFLESPSIYSQDQIKQYGFLLIGIDLV